jgi:two-component system OmpR family response regulator
MKNHILVVDDEANIRELLAQCLVSSGYRVTSVGSASEAFKACREEPPDLIIADLQLGDADGLEMIAKIKVALPDRPVILLTGVLFDPEVVDEVLSSKVACYLEKTSSLARILESVRRLLRQQRPPSSA